MDSFINSKWVEIFNKISQGNKFYQFQAISKLYSTISDNSRNEAEKKKLLNKIIETLGSLKSKNGCLALIKILHKSAKDGLIEPALIINSFLIMINSKTENSSYCLEAITELLLGVKGVEAYSIRNPSHPFIEILRNSRDEFSGLLIFKEIRRVFESSDFPIAIGLMKPVLLHLFLEESNLKHQVANYLIKLTTETKSNELSSELIKLYFSCLKKSDYKSLFLLESIDSAIKMLENDSTNIENSESTQKNLTLLDLTKILIDIDQFQSFDCSHQWLAITNFIVNTNETKRRKVITNELMETLAENLDKIGLNNLIPYLDLINKLVVYYNGRNKLPLAIFMPNLLYWGMCFGSLEPLGSFDKLIECCSRVGLNIEERINNDGSLSQNNDVEAYLFNVIEYEGIDGCGSNEEKINTRKLNELAGNFVLNDSDLQLIKRILTIFKNLVTKWPSLYPTFYIIYIYKLRSSRNHEIINYLVNSMVDLIAPKVDINLCLNVIKSLMVQESQTIKICCMLQLTKLCTMKYDYLVYPYLSKELVTVKNTNLGGNEKLRLQVLYTKAYCIFNIISYRPDYYAQELLAPISSLLNLCTLPNDQGVCAVLIDSLAILCESQVVDMISTWNALYQQFKNETRCLALSAYCRFMSVASKLDHLSDIESDKNNFYLKMVQILWSMCKLKHSPENALVISSALTELSKFKIECFKCSYLPIVLQEKLKDRNKKQIQAEENKEKSLDEIFPQIPALSYIDLVSFLSPESYKGLSDLFVTILAEEIDSIPRRTISFAREKVYTHDDQQTAQKNFYDIIRAYLVDECKRDIEKMIKSDSLQLDEIICLLFVFDATGDRNLEGKLAKRHIKSYWDQYKETFKLVLERANKIKIAEDTFEIYKIGFLRFIKNAYLACLQAVQFQLQLELEKCKDQKEKIEEKIKMACCESRDTLVELLVNIYFHQTNPAHQTNNELFLLVLYTIIQTTSDQILANSNNTTPNSTTTNDDEVIHNQRKWLEVVLDFILNIRENKTACESDYIDQFNYNQVHSRTTLKFLYALYTNSTTQKSLPNHILNYFMTLSLESCTRVKISSFLIQYVHKNVNASIESLSFSYDLTIVDAYLFQSIGVYVRHLIRSSEKFEIEMNVTINKVMRKILDGFEGFLRWKKTISTTTEQDGITKNYLKLIVQCLFDLYNDESIYYDDEDLLSSFFNQVYCMIVDGGEQKPDFLIESLVHLACISYKSNLIANEKVIFVYDILVKKSKFNKLLAFYSRFLLGYGFYESMTWIQALFSKWNKYYNDFKLNLVTDETELEYSLEGLLALLSGISIQTLIFDHCACLPVELENLLKPESTMKDIVKFVRTSKTLTITRNLNIILAYMQFKFIEQIKYDEIYSTQNTYDYLDNQSLLRGLTNEALRISKTLTITDHDLLSHQFKFLVTTLLHSCKASKTKSLPPVNWLNLVNSLIKSQFGQKVESELIELTLIQVATLNSAFSLIKNFLIDTNYFTHLQISSQKVVLANLKVLFERFNDVLLKKFLSKLKIFIFQKSNANVLERSIFIQFLTTIIDSVCAYFVASDRDKNEDQIKLKEISEFFVSLAKDYTLFVGNKERKVVDKLVKTLVRIKDDRLSARIMSLDDLLPVDSSFLMNFYIRSSLASQLNQTLGILNEPIECFIRNIELVNIETKSAFIKILAKCLLELNQADFKQNLESSNKSNVLKNNLLNWMLELMDMVRSISVKDDSKNGLEFGLVLFGVFIYCVSVQSMDLYEANDEENEIEWRRCLTGDFFETSLKKFTSHFYWKQLNGKILDWLMALVVSKNFPSEHYQLIKNSIIGIFKMEKPSDQIWLKFANMINKKMDDI